MSNPVEKLEQSIGHDCQTGCGRRADVVVVQLATGECDIMCAPCNVAMMAAVIEQVGQSIGDGDTAADLDAAAEATRTAAAVLAAD